MRLATSQGAAWRGLYLYLGGQSAHGQQLGRVVLDPNWGVRPTLKVAVPVGWYTSCAGVRCVRQVEARIVLPYIPWRWCSATRYARPVVALYKASQWFYHKLDGRYGWGAS